MLDSLSKKNTVIQCLLALEDADFPEGTKLPSECLLMAYITAMEKESQSEEASLTDLFIVELRQLLDRVSPPQTAEILAESSRVVESMKVRQAQGESGLPPKIIALQFATAMLSSKLSKEAQHN